MQSKDDELTMIRKCKEQKIVVICLRGENTIEKYMWKIFLSTMIFDENAFKIFYNSGICQQVFKLNIGVFKLNVQG